MNEPFAVAFDVEGRMYGVEYKRGNRLFRVGPEGDATVEVVAAGFHGLHDVAVAPNGLVYLADTFNHRIRVFDPATGTVSVMGGPVRRASAATRARPRLPYSSRPTADRSQRMAGRCSSPTLRTRGCGGSISTRGS